MVISMKQKQEALQKPLDAKTIDFRVQSINKGGYATILAYKDARVDINRLNEVFGVGGWQRKHERIDGKEFCSVGVWNSDLDQWVWVQDCGTESNTEAAKGQSSDAFKRACFNLGIGTELYDYPVISIKLNQNEYKVDGNFVKATWDLKLRDWLWHTEFDGHKLTFIAAKDNHGKIRFTWGQMKPKPDAAPEPVQSPEPKPQPAMQAVKTQAPVLREMPAEMFAQNSPRWIAEIAAGKPLVKITKSATGHGLRFTKEQLETLVDVRVEEAV